MIIAWELEQHKGVGGCPPVPVWNGWNQWKSFELAVIPIGHQPASRGDAVEFRILWIKVGGLCVLG